MTPRQSRFRMPYLETPRCRRRWWTGTSMTRAPCICRSAGKNRCIPSKSGRAASSSERMTLREQPTSETPSCNTRSRTRLAMREETRRTLLSCRSIRTPQTRS